MINILDFISGMVFGCIGTIMTLLVMTGHEKYFES